MTRGDLAFSCVLIKQPKGFSALCPDLDVASEGATTAKAKRMLHEAIELHLETAFENNLPIFGLSDQMMTRGRHLPRP